MAKRKPRKPATSVPAHPAAVGPWRLPVELHKAWLQYLSQPELLRAGAVCKAWRALVLDEPHFYLAVFLQTIRGRHQKSFVQHLDYATRRKLPIGVSLDFPYSPNKASCDILANNVFPAIKRAMPYIRKLSIVCASPLPASSLAFLQAPAPNLREFVYKLDPEYDPYEEDWASDDGGSDYGDDDGDYYDDEEPPAQTASPLPARLFACAAPKLTTIDLYSIPLPAAPVAAFGRVTHGTLGDLQPIPSLGLGAHFPAAMHLNFTLEEECLHGDTTCSRGAWLPARLASLDLHVPSPVLGALVQLADVAAVPHLRVAFDWQYESERYVTYSFNASVGRVGIRDAAWAACLARIAKPRSVEISCSSSDDGQPADVRVAVSDGARSVTFYAEDVFADELDADGDPYGPLASLRCLAADLACISICQANLHAIFHIAQKLPALREITVILSGRQRVPFFYDKESTLGIEFPVLERLVLCCDALPRGTEIASHQLAQFARAMGLRDSAAARPRLVLRGVRVVRGTGHTPFFAL